MNKCYFCTDFNRFSEAWWYPWVHYKHRWMETGTGKGFAAA